MCKWAERPRAAGAQFEWCLGVCSKMTKEEIGGFVIWAAFPPWQLAAAGASNLESTTTCFGSKAFTALGSEGRFVR